MHSNIEHLINIIMPIPTNKTELQTAISCTYSKLRKDLLLIPADITTIKAMDGHAKNSKMSVENLMSYLIGWGELVLKWNYKKDRREKIDFPETGYKWNELGKLAQKFYSDYEHLDFNQLLTKLDETVNQIHTVIDSKSSYELYEVSWYEKWTFGRMIQFNTSSPYSNARARIRKWTKEQNLDKLQ